MVSRLIAVFACVALLAALVEAQTPPPREIWPQATAAALNDDLDTATKKTVELIETGKSYGIKTYPVYAASAAALARESDRTKKKDQGEWATKTASQLDPRSPVVAFTNADRAAAAQRWGRAIPAMFVGLGNVFTNYRTRILTRADLLIVLSMTIALTTAIFAIALFIRYGRAMAHDFREILGKRIHGGSVSVLAFALMFLPLFLWLGPLWLVFYWFVIFFSYANWVERVLIIFLALLFAGVPIALDYSANLIAGVDSPVVVAAISSAERAYQPEALRRLQELAGIVSDNPTMHILLGNLNLFEGNEQQASVHYRRSVELRDSAGAHVNLGNLHFLNNDFAAAITEYQRAQQLDPQLAIAFYNNSVASGETYKFDEQGQMLEKAKSIDRSYIEGFSQTPPTQKIVIYHPPLPVAWREANAIARRGVARQLFGNYAHFDPAESALNPVTLGSALSVLLAILVLARRRRTGFAGQCIKCGRTFCPRCKSARESATYCTQCIHIYLKRDGVSLATKRSKLDEVSEHHNAIIRRNKLFATFLPGAAQVIEGRTVAGFLGLFMFVLFVSFAVLIGRLAPAIGPVAETTKLAVRVTAILLALLIWFFMSLPVYRRKAAA